MWKPKMREIKFGSCSGGSVLVSWKSFSTPFGGCDGPFAGSPSRFFGNQRNKESLHHAGRRDTLLVTLYSLLARCRRRPSHFTHPCLSHVELPCFNFTSSTENETSSKAMPCLAMLLKGNK